MKTLILSSLLILCAATMNAQNSTAGSASYKLGIGARVWPFGVSFKSNLTKRSRSFELVAYFHDGMVLSLMYYWNFILNTAKNLKFYIGPTVMGGYRDDDAGGGAVFGVGGVVGFDYKFLRLPLNLSLDWQPSIQFAKETDYKNWGGIAVRFTL